MGRPKRPYPLGKFRMKPGRDKTKAYAIFLEYTWGDDVVRKSTNIYAKEADWNQKANLGRGALRPSFGSEYQRTNALLLARVERVDNLLAEYNHNHPNQITKDVIRDLLEDKPLTRIDKGKDFAELATERLESEYSRNRIGRSRYANGLSSLKILGEFLLSTKRGTHKPDGVYVGEVTPELIDALIDWRRNIKKNSDHTINHALTPILKACAYATEMKMMDAEINARLQDMRVVPKVSYAEDDEGFDGKYLTMDEMGKLADYYKECNEPRRKEFLEMFFFAFHACGLRVVDVMTLQWKHINFEKKELRKIMIKTGKRHTIPLTEQALELLHTWQEKRGDNKYVFDLMSDSVDVDDDEALYKARNNATKCINQSLIVVGEQLNLRFRLSMHVARHTFAVLALNNGLSMSVVSRLLGHGSTDITEKVYAKFLPETLSGEVARLDPTISNLSLKK